MNSSIVFSFDNANSKRSSSGSWNSFKLEFPKPYVFRKPERKQVNFILLSKGLRRPLKQETPLPMISCSSVLIKRNMIRHKLPKISSQQWCIYESSQNRVLQSLRDHEQVEIASLTKIMTLFVSINLSRKFNLSWGSPVTVSEYAASVNGTVAGLRTKDTVLLKDLFYALMLPSGNDASIALAEFFSKCINSESSGKGLFIAEMNRTAKEIGLVCTTFGNPHGLSHKRNLSCANDVCKLTALCMKDRTFREVVSTKNYTCEILDRNQKLRTEKWVNTNLALEFSFNGVKTGVTNKAGPCLCVSKVTNTRHLLIVTILNCKSMDARWEEIKKLTDWSEHWLKFCN